MLSAACERFRADFEPREPFAAELVAHRRDCDACDAWADALERAIAAAAPRPLPASLAARLAAIGGGEVPCDDVRRLYAAALGRREEDEDGNDAVVELDAAASRHLAACARCREVYAPLRAAAATAQRPLPAALRDRLLAIAAGAAAAVRPPLPYWLRDGRAAVAASYVLTTFLMLALGVGDAAALLRGTSEAIHEPALAFSPATSRRDLAQVVRDGWSAAAEALTDDLRALEGVATRLLVETLDVLLPGDRLEPRLERLLADPRPSAERPSSEGDPDEPASQPRD